MELEKSNDMQDGTQQMTKMEVAEEVLSQFTGGALIPILKVAGGGAAGAFIGAGIGALVKGDKKKNVSDGAGIGAIVGTLAGAAAHKW